MDKDNNLYPPSHLRDAAKVEMSPIMMIKKNNGYKDCTVYVEEWQVRRKKRHECDWFYLIEKYCTGMYGSITVCLRRHVEWMTPNSEDTRRGATDEDLRVNTWLEKSPVRS